MNKPTEAGRHFQVGPPERYLIVNSDDFGLSEGVNHGILKAHTEGILTSASLMVRQPAAAQATESARDCPRLSLGLHLDLAEWVYLNGDWQLKYEVVPTRDAGAVAAEVRRQLGLFRRLLGKDPTHIDSHQHLHRHEPVRSVLLEAAHKVRVPLRECSEAVRFCGDFYGQTGEGEPFPEGVTVENLLKIFANLEPGWTEVSCHAGDDELLDSVYNKERKVEMNVLCDPRVRASLDALSIRLCSFSDFLRLNSTNQT
jgi:chitin disaccharide deacetylase